MPARRNVRSEVGKPAGSMMCASMPKQAERRRIVPVFWAISGSNRAIRMAAIQPSDVAAHVQFRPQNRQLMRLLVIRETVGLRSCRRGANRTRRIVLQRPPKAPCGMGSFAAVSHVFPKGAEVKDAKRSAARAGASA